MGCSCLLPLQPIFQAFYSSALKIFAIVCRPTGSRVKAQDWKGLGIVEKDAIEQGVGSTADRPRLEEVAARVGLSPSTVSLVLRNIPGPSDETRRRVLQAADELGYRPNRSASLLARRRSHLLGVSLEVRNSFHAELVEELQAASEQVGYELVLSTVTRTQNEQRAVETLLDSQCEALILLGPDAPPARLTALAMQLPVIAVGRRVKADGVDVVRSADDKGTSHVVDYLAGLGHRAITYVDGGKGIIAGDRRRGYRTAMRRHKLNGWIRIISGDHTEESGLRAAAALLDEPELPTAVVTFNDRCAVGLLDALNRAGVDVPGSVSIVGYDDSPLARLAHINLTTVSQNTQQQAEHAVAVAVERLDEQRAMPREVVLSPRLVIRRTASPPRSST
jgi:DNA-binding LacI/PurR family transcriptional regulator